jgi:hypothetical protein
LDRLIRDLDHGRNKRGNRDVRNAREFDCDRHVTAVVPIIDTAAPRYTSSVPTENACKTAGAAIVVITSVVAPEAFSVPVDTPPVVVIVPAPALTDPHATPPAFIDVAVVAPSIVTPPCSAPAVAIVPIPAFSDAAVTALSVQVPAARVPAVWIPPAPALRGPAVTAPVEASINVANNAAAVIAPSVIIPAFNNAVAAPSVHVPAARLDCSRASVDQTRGEGASKRRAPPGYRGRVMRSERNRAGGGDGVPQRVHPAARLDLRGRYETSRS